MKTVCILVQNVYDIDRRVRRKAEALTEEGYSVDVLALRGANGRKSYDLNGVNVYTIQLGKRRGSLTRYTYEYVTFFFWALVRTTLLMWRRRYDLVDVNTLPDFLIFAAGPAKWMGARLVLDMHEITPEFYMSKFRIAETDWAIRLMKFLERISVGFADHVITVNEPIEEVFIRRGLPPSKSTVVMNAVDEMRFSANSKESAAGRSQGRDKFVMVYHGTLTHIYGLDIAIEAFALVHEQMPGAELWILGSGTEEDALAELAKERGLESKVKLPGMVAPDEIPDWLSQCDVGVLPIRRDIFLDLAFPNKLPEFIVMGITVVTSRLRAIQHYFSEDALAYFEPNDPADLSRQMLRTYRDPELRARLVAQAAEEYEPIRWELMKQRYLTLMNKLARDGK